MGKPSPEEKRRNKSLFKDYLSKKYTMIQMVNKYKIGPTRIYQIVSRARKRLTQ